jgi:hypothetical protein
MADTCRPFCHKGEKFGIHDARHRATRPRPSDATGVGTGHRPSLRLGEQMKFLLIINAAVTAALAVVVYHDHQKIPAVETRQELVGLINANVLCLTGADGGAPNFGFTDWEYVDACLNDKGWLPWPQPPGYPHLSERLQLGHPTQVEMLQRRRAAEGQEPGANRLG